MKQCVKYMKHLILFLWMAFCMNHTAEAYSAFNNYSSAISVSSIVIDQGITWAGTRGGLLRIDPQEYTVLLFSVSEQFPDLDITALCVDDEHNLWIGTKSGYLYKRTPAGKQLVISSYVAAKWNISKLVFHNHHLIIGSINGCSVFDTKTLKVIQNATSFVGLKTANVSALNVINDTLYVGLADGVAQLDISSDNIEKVNFLDETIWKTTVQAKPTFTFVLDSASKVIRDTTISTLWRKQILYRNNTMLMTDTIIVETFKSKITAIVALDKNTLWVGTESHYVYQFDGKRWLQFKDESLTFRGVQKIYIDHTNNKWFLPQLQSGSNSNREWFKGIAQYTGSSWTMYSTQTTKNFGSIGDGTAFQGICEDRAGNMWFGANGATKKYVRAENRWDRYYVGGNSKQYPDFQLLPAINEITGISIPWNKADAIALDSNGYLWFGVYKNDSGSLVCYNPSIPDPKIGDCRHFLPKNSPFYFDHPTILSVDAGNRFFLVDNSNRCLVYSYKSDPFKDTLTILFENSFPSKVWDVTAMEDTSTWILSSERLYIYKNGKMIECSNLRANMTCIEVEEVFLQAVDGKRHSSSQRLYATLLLGTMSEGLARAWVNVHVNAQGIVDTCKMDSIKYWKVEQGLLSNSITSIALDRKEGYLWIGTDEGVSRFAVGHTFYPASNKTIEVYPNPYSKSRHKEIVFSQCAPSSQVIVYTLDGRVVSQITDKKSAVLKHQSAWTYFWQPPIHCVPGTYIYSVIGQRNILDQKVKTGTGKILIVP